MDQHFFSAPISYLQKMTNEAEIKCKTKQKQSKRIKNATTKTEKEGGRGRGRGRKSLLRFDFCFNVFKTEN